MDFLLKLNEDEVNVVVTCLLEAPAKMSFHILQNIKSQVTIQTGAFIAKENENEESKGLKLVEKEKA